eukprot:COSAG05_NODE_2377_length_3156_cov_10.926398_1_plen_62_part_00
MVLRPMIREQQHVACLVVDSKWVMEQVKVFLLVKRSVTLVGLVSQTDSYQAVSLASDPIPP